MSRFAVAWTQRSSTDARQTAQTQTLRPEWRCTGVQARSATPRGSYPEAHGHQCCPQMIHRQSFAAALLPRPLVMEQVGDSGVVTLGCDMDIAKVCGEQRRCDMSGYSHLQEDAPCSALTWRQCGQKARNEPACLSALRREHLADLVLAHVLICHASLVRELRGYLQTSLVIGHRCSFEALRGVRQRSTLWSLHASIICTIKYHQTMMGIPRTHRWTTPQPMDNSTHELLRPWTTPQPTQPLATNFCMHACQLFQGWHEDMHVYMYIRTYMHSMT